ncbi:MAG: TonB-dependent receptor [Bacteroidota bacterium]
MFLAHYHLTALSVLVVQKEVLALSFFLFFSFQLSGQTTPSITIQKSSIKVGDLLEEITRQSGADFAFNSKLLDKNEVLDFEIRNATLTETLDLLVQKIDVTYRIIEGQIVLNFAEKKENFYTISGYLSEEATGEVLIGASIILNGTSRGVVTNEFGYYVMTPKEGTYDLTFSYVGFEAKNLQIDLRKATQKNVTLKMASFDLSTVIVELPLQEQLNTKQLDVIRFSPEQLNSLPEFGGESGLVKGMQSLPGINVQGDGSAFFNVRGGERDQNVIFIDDAPVFGISHLLGFYSMVIPDFTKSIDIYKSDMPVSLGDRLSSIVSIRTNDGNLNKLKFSGAINPFVNRFTLETPIAKQKSSVFVSYRRSSFDRLIERAAEGVSYHFQDFHFKWNWKVNDKNRLFLTLIQAGDYFTSPSAVSDVNWGSGAAALRWNHLFHPQLFSNTTLYSSNYAYNVTFAPNFWTSQLGMVGVKTDFTQYKNSKYQAKFGFNLQLYSSTPGSFTLDSTINVLPNFSQNLSRKGVLYYEGRYDFTEKWQFKGGLRLTTWANLGPRNFYELDGNYEVSDTIEAGIGAFNRYAHLAPRLSLRYQISPTTQLKLSYGTYQQYLQLILDSVSPFSALEVWLPSSPNVRPQRAQQWALNYLQVSKPLQLEFALAAYYKTAQNQIDYAPHATTFLNPLLEAELRFGTARSYGLELMLKKEWNKASGWLSYTYSRTFRTTPDLNEGLEYRAVQDRPHELSLALSFPLKKRILCSTYWTSSSGTTFTSPVGFYDFNGSTTPIFGERNNDRLPAYHRLDFSIKFLLNKNPNARYQHDLTFALYNAIGHKNIYAIRFNKLEHSFLSPLVRTNIFSDEPLSPSQIDLIRFFPSLTYKFKL